MADAKRGGARPGAGRPKGETTTMVRVPDGCLDQVRQLISVYRNGGELPSVPSQPVGDAHNQFRSRLPAFDSLPDLTMSVAHQAWAVYLPVISGHKAYSELKERYFKMVELDEGYTYLFLLQLLERLVKLPKTDQDFPVQWCNIRELRQFAKDLYKANPQWH
ncbi:hypothetical protein ACTG22_06185 [Aeromonas caviae]|uniref:hypothetical protein n=1 Tax=Aeromonas caviae TaxID=648 RepID=UPI0030B0D43B